MDQADSVHSTPPENTSALLPRNPPVGATTGGLYLPTDITPETLFQAIGRLRKQAQDEIDRLFAFLDATDDPDLEEDGSAEPSLASVGSTYAPADQTRWADGDRTDREESHGDDEPSLGWTDAGQFGNAPGDDLEDEHDGREPDVCNEPDLGSRDQEVNQVAAWNQPAAWVIDGEVDILDDDGATHPAKWRR